MTSQPSIRALVRRAALAAATVVFAAGCHRSASVFSSAGPAARSIATLGTVLLVGFCVVIVFMTALVYLAATRRSGTLAEHAPADAAGGERWIWYGGFAIPAVVFGAILVASLRETDMFPLHDGGHYRPDIELVGHQWWWEVRYVGAAPEQLVTTANEIHIPVGWDVEIALESQDVIHSFWVPALHGKVDLIPGQPNRIRIVGDTVGRYDGQCAEYCGVEHAQMKLSVVVESLEDYERWLANERAPAIEPRDPDAAAGRALFESGPCALCHTVRGTGARARTGPDLTHVGRRPGLAANSLPNSPAYLEAWITHAQSLKPGSLMPNLTEYDGEQLQALTHYLETLK